MAVEARVDSPASGLRRIELRPRLNLAVQMRHHDDVRPAEKAVQEVLRSRRSEMLARIRRRLGTLVDAEDVLQMATQRALERADQVRDPSRAEAWVGRVVQSVVMDELRRPRSRVVALEDCELSSRGEAEEESCWCVLAQAQRLKPEYSAILKRVVIDGAKLADVASELGLTPNNAMVRLHRARAALRRQLARHCGTTHVRSCSACGCEERGCCPRPEGFEMVAR